jgi:hypothetical protein
MDTIDRLNEIFEKHEAVTSGSFHNCLWQIMINHSLGNEEAAFERLQCDDQVIIAFGSGGYIPACFDIEPGVCDEVLDDLNEQVFGLTHEGALRVVFKSMNRKVQS